MTAAESMQLIKPWKCLPGFPQNDDGIQALSERFAAIAGDKESGTWLSQKVLNGCARCPTPIEMRRIFARKFPPADGIEPNEADMYDLMDNTGGRKAS